MRIHERTVGSSAIGARAIALLLAVGAAAQTAGAQTTYRVEGDRVNLRARPEANAEVVGQVDDGHLIVPLRESGEWYAVDAPADVYFWVHRAFVQDGAVQVSKLNVRSGPGINYSKMGVLGRGDPLVVEDTFGEWLKVRPPTDMPVWIHRSVVREERPRVAPAAPRPDREARVARRTAEPRPAAPEILPLPTPSAARQPGPVEEAAPAYVPTGLDLVPLEGQGKRNSYMGTLRRKSLFSSDPTRYRLVQPRGNGFITVCHVKGNRDQLDEFHGAVLEIEGREYWVQGESEPVLVPERIIPKVAP
jgi:SH3-like domain-containing protein